MNPKKFLFFPLFFPGFIMSRFDQKPLLFDEHGVRLEICSGPSLHKFINGKCIWCSKRIDDLSKELDDRVEKDVESPRNRASSQHDFNSLNSMTVNPPRLDEVPYFDCSDDPIKSEFGDVSSMDLNGVTAYCMKCKIKVSVLDSKYFDEETRRGVRHYLKGSCAICGSKIHAIVKKQG